MKKLLTIVAISVISLSVTAQQKRQTKQNTANQQKTHKNAKRADMIKELELTDGQRTQMKANHAEYKAKRDELKNQQLSGTALADKELALRKEEQSKRESLLTNEQRIKKADLQSKRTQEKEDRQAKHAEKIKNTYGLSDDQASRMKQHNEMVHARMKAIKDNPSLSREQKHEQIKAVQAASKEDRKKILTAEQLKKMEQKEKHKNNKKKSKA